MFKTIAKSIFSTSNHWTFTSKFYKIMANFEFKNSKRKERKKHAINVMRILCTYIEVINNNSVICMKSKRELFQFEYRNICFFFRRFGFLLGPCGRKDKLTKEQRRMRHNNKRIFESSGQNQSYRMFCINA